MTTAARGTPYWLTSPAVMVMLALIAVPLLLTLSLSFYSFDPVTGVKNNLTWGNYLAVLTDEYYHEIFLRTAWLALLTTLICIVIGVPEAYVLRTDAAALARGVHRRGPRSAAGLGGGARLGWACCWDPRA